MFTARPLSKIVLFAAHALLVSITVLCPTMNALASDGYEDVINRGTLRHLGVPYAHFVTGSGDGLDVELVRLFAAHLGVRYEFVLTSWEDVLSDLVGKKVIWCDQTLSFGEPVPIRGDVVANGLTILPWREKAIIYSTPTFPSGVWLVSRADSPIAPITPSGDPEKDIQATIALAEGLSVMAIAGGCLDPAMNRLQGTGADIKLMPHSMNLNELIPAVMKGEADATLIDVPDALVAIQKWSGQIKVIGPLSVDQQMGLGFAKSSEKLRDAFNQFFFECVRNGAYQQLVKKYYPSIFVYYPEFFQHMEERADAHGF